MKIQFEIEIADDDVPDLMTAIDSKKESFAGNFQAHAQAAVDEYVAMYLARDTPVSGSDIRQLRFSSPRRASLHGWAPR